MNKKLQAFEIDFFLEAVFLRYGYDFRDYAKASLKRRIFHSMQECGAQYVSELVPKVLYEDSFFEQFLTNMSITVTSMFRDPQVFKSIRENVFPILKTYSRINIWHVGCATGEEVYSMAIMLEEANLLNRTRLYATDYNNKSLEIAKKGLYSIRSINREEVSKNYILSGGTGSFSDYYRANFESVKINESLKENIVFANHNLMMDKEFAEMHLILCRNVLIYFDKTFKDKVLNLLDSSLIKRGFLVLGDKESLHFSPICEKYSEVESGRKIYRQKNIL